MPISDQAHITNVIPGLPAGVQRDRVFEFLIDEYPDEGALSKFEDVQTVLDIRSLGVSVLVERGLSETDAAWLLVQLGGAKRGPKPKVKS